jgi:hypothetical protein
VNDYEIDVESFLETGGSVLPQAYRNDWAEYEPERCVFFWTRVGVPRERLNLTVSLTAGDTSKTRFSGADWLPRLRAAGLGAALSLFMAEFATEADLAALEPLLRAAPAPAGPDEERTRRAIIDLVGAQVHHWFWTERRSWPWIKTRRGIYAAGNRVAPQTFPLP